VKVNKNAKILYGKLAGFEGKVIAADYATNSVIIQIDKWSNIETIYENVSQDK
jgi:ribosomal protein L24